ncbi:MAG: hypothetical protein HQL79_12465, partial [Magnetococcales bacterium]|nr:hypothetical protein [Magnetococcales bacterium]
MSNTDDKSDVQDWQIKKIEGYLTEIRQRAAEYSLYIGDADQMPWHEQPGVTEHDGVITIYGGRGTGKTTLIKEVAQKLRQESGDLVIGPISPVHFQETKSLFSYMLAVLNDKLFGGDQKSVDCCQPPRGKGGHRSLSDQGEELRNKLRDTRSYVARTIPVSLDTLVHSGKSGEDFAYHFTNMQDRHLKALNHFPDLIHDLLEYYKNKKQSRSKNNKEYQSEKSDGLLVVVLDDCDLYPDLIKIVLDDIQRMGRSPQIAILFTSNEKELFRVVGENILKTQTIQTLSYLEQCGLTNHKQLQDETTRYIRKVCPIYREIRLDGGLNDYKIRIDFVPIGTHQGANGSNPTLRQVLESFKFIGGSNALFPNLLSLFDFGYSGCANEVGIIESNQNNIERNTFKYSPFCGLLPYNWRSLFGFYRLVHQLMLRTEYINDIDGILLDEIKATELIWIMVQMSRYYMTPIQADQLNNFIFWRGDGGDRRVSIETYKLQWSAIREDKPTADLTIPIDVFYPWVRTKCDENSERIVAIEYFFIPDAGVIPSDGQSKGKLSGKSIIRNDNDEKVVNKFSYNISNWGEMNLGNISNQGVSPPQSLTNAEMEKKRLDNVYQWRFLSFALELVRLCDFERVLFGRIPPAFLPYAFFGPSSTSSMSGKYTHDGCYSVPMPMLIPTKFPSYSSYFLLRRFWNDHLSKVAYLRSVSPINSKDRYELDQVCVEYLSTIYIYLLAMRTSAWKCYKSSGLKLFFLPFLPIF